NLMLLVTGSQGERRAASAQLANGKYMGLELQEGDLFLFSSKNLGSVRLSQLRCPPPMQNAQVLGLALRVCPSDTELKSECLVQRMQLLYRLLQRENRKSTRRQRRFSRLYLLEI
ncbi:MAG: hypothetical protein AAF357_12260, partial [Verrucomicrobiota bacterium]